jgi:hypothetical protein
VVAADIEPALLGGDVSGDQGYRNVHVQQHSAFKAVDVIMPVDSPVIAARLVGKRQLLDETVRGQQVERSIHRAVANAGVTPAHTLENLARGQMRIGFANLFEDFRPLRCVSESISGHQPTLLNLIMSLTNLTKSYHASLILPTY